MDKNVVHKNTNIEANSAYFFYHNDLGMVDIRYCKTPTITSHLQDETIFPFNSHEGLSVLKKSELL